MDMDITARPLPVVIVGAGPVGLAAAAHLLARGLEPVVLEAGPSAATAVRGWGHVRLFSAWSELVDPAAAGLLAPTGWRQPPAGTYPTGAEWAELYLQPLADVLGDRVRYSTTVIGATRQGRDRVVDADRAERPFVVHTRGSDGTEQRLTARALLDASGTYSRPGPLGGDGLPALGERALASRISYRIPDLTEPATRDRHAGRRTAVVGAGHSALTALVSLAELAEQEPGTRAVWVLRRDAFGGVFGGGDTDQLPARGALGLRARAAVADGHIEVVHGFRTHTIEEHDGLVTLVADNGRRIENLHEVVALTGLRPDHSWTAELRLDLDERLEAPVRLAPLIDPNVHSCGTVYPHGAAELAHPDPDLYLVGMKSYGRAPTFLALTGYEQVRSIAADLAGDAQAAARVELTLPDTGVCGGSGLFDQPDTAEAEGGCCTAPVAAQIGAPATASSC